MQTGPTESSRDVVVCCDGTWNEPRGAATNVLRVVGALSERRETSCFYHPGVGTVATTSKFTGGRRRVAAFLDGATAWSFEPRVAMAYQFIVENWRPGDRLFLFGFSRGAFAVRVVAALLHRVGLLKSQHVNLIPHLIALYRKRSGTRGDRKYWSGIEMFRNTFAVNKEGDKRSSVPVTFLGVWDTVKSVGYFTTHTYPHTDSNPSVASTRHALAIDERRAFFQPERILCKGAHQRERWFAGVHADIGGGYPHREGQLWRPPYEWVMEGAIEAGLPVDSSRILQLPNGTEPVAEPWLERIHDSMRWYWRPAEIVLHRWFDRMTKRSRCRVGLGRRRVILPAADIAPSVAKRISAGVGYAPSNLPSDSDLEAEI